MISSNRKWERDNADVNKKKRNRINKEKVDVNNVATSNFAAPRPNVQGKGGAGGHGGNNGGNAGVATTKATITTGEITITIETASKSLLSNRK